MSRTSPSNGISGEKPDFLIALYFSASAFVSQIFGDIVPLGASRFLAVIEGLFGLLFLTILISKVVSARQESMIVRMYHLSYINFFKEQRDNIGEQRLVLRDISTRLTQNPTDEEVLADARAQLNRHGTGPFRYLASLIGGLYGFLVHEKGREQLILEELDVYHFERIMHTLWITAREAQLALKRLEQSGFRLNSRGRENLRRYLIDTEKLSDWIGNNYQSQEISERKGDVNECIQSMRTWLDTCSEGSDA